MKKYLPLLLLTSLPLMASEELAPRYDLKEPTAHLHTDVAPGDYTRSHAMDDLQLIADRMEFASNELLKVSLKLNELTKELEESTQHN